MRKLNNTNIACIIGLWVWLCYILVSSTSEMTGELWMYILLSGGFIFIPIWKHYQNKPKK